MKSYINLKNKLDKLDNEQETTNQKMIEALSSIYKKIKNQNKKLSEIVPQNVEIISMSKLINRIEIIKTEILSSPISEIKKIELLKAIDENLTNLNDINYTKKDITNKIIKIEILLHQRKEYVKEKYEKVKKINERLNIINEKIEKNIKEENSDIIQNSKANDLYINEILSLEEEKKEIMLDKELCEDIKFLYNYDITKKEKKVDNENVYELADDIIKKQVEEVKMYQDLSKTKLEELELKLKKASKEYVDEFAIVVENKNVLKNDFINGLHEILKINLEDYFEIKDKLGVEYVTSKNGNISKIITVKEVIEGNYKDLKNQIINKYATLIELANVDEENLLEVRNFVIEMGPEFVSLFDNLWIHDDPKRKQKIKELTLNKNNENK